MDAFADGYERAQRLVVRQEEAAGREFIDDLLHGRGYSGHLAARAERFGLRLSRVHAVAVAEGPAKYDETDPVPRRVEGALFGRFENPFTGTNPADPTHRYTLRTAVIGALLFDWPGRPL